MDGTEGRMACKRGAGMSSGPRRASEGMRDAAVGSKSGKKCGVDIVDFEKR